MGNMEEVSVKEFVVGTQALTQEQVECDPRDLQFHAASAGVPSDSVTFHKLRFG